jgi:hypothetical protein
VNFAAVVSEKLPTRGSRGIAHDNRTISYTLNRPAAPPHVATVHGCRRASRMPPAASASRCPSRSSAQKRARAATRPLLPSGNCFGATGVNRRRSHFQNRATLPGVATLRLHFPAHQVQPNR